MATLQSKQILAGGTKSIISHGLANNGKIYYFEVAAAAAILTTDAIEFGYVPPGFRLICGWVEAADVGAGTSVLNIGDVASATRLLAASTIIQSGGVVQLTAATGIFYKYPSGVDTLITGSITVASGDAAGTISLALMGVIEATAS